MEARLTYPVSYPPRTMRRYSRSRARQKYLGYSCLPAAAITLCVIALSAAICFLSLEGSQIANESTRDVSGAQSVQILGAYIADDNKPASERCYMTEAEAESDFEEYKNQLLSQATALGSAKITHYCCEEYPHICGTGTGITASGTKVTPGVSCAVDPRVIPLGSTVVVDFGDDGIQVLSADDTGGAIKGNRIDIAVPTHEEALQLGVKTATVYVLTKD